ncbi:MAG: S41 family peptidase [Bacteroidota bacterium]
MKNSLFALCLLFITSYSKAQYLDEISKKPHPATNIKKDISLIQNILEKEHPNLYLYITKKELNYKFDSLRNTITTPLTSTELYVKLLSVLSYVGDGHLTVNIDYTKFTHADITFLKTPLWMPPIYKFGYRVIGNRVFIIKNSYSDSTVVQGTEILSINNVPVKKLIDTLSHYITSDGYNTTFKQYLLNAGLFAERFRFLYKDVRSLNLKLKYHDNLSAIKIDTFKMPGYDSIGGITPPNHEYKILTADSNIAYLKIRTFLNPDDYVGYHPAFADIQKRKIKTLILDLRGNGGGLTGWASSVFSHFIDTPTYFYRLPPEVADQKLLYGNQKIKDWLKMVAQKKWQYPIVTPHTNIFKGKIYVLINGGSFSATSLLAANMRTLKNITFVGEETGGSKNVWTAGIMKTIILPESKLSLTYGYVPAFFGDITDINGRGIMPDVPITYTIEDILANKDLEMDWVLKDIAKNNSGK